MEFLMNNFYLLASDCNILGDSFHSLLQDIFVMIKIAVPCLVFVLCIVDFSKAVIAQDEKTMKEAQNHAIKRIIIGVVIFFIPTLINILLDLAGNISGTCNIG